MNYLQYIKSITYTLKPAIRSFEKHCSRGEVLMMVYVYVCVYVCIYVSPYTNTCLMDTGVWAWLSLGDLSLYVRTSCHAEAETTLPREDRSPLHRSTLLPCLQHKGNAPAWKCGSDTKPAGNQMSLRRVGELMLPLSFILSNEKEAQPKWI